jgi:hypothetical protein
MSRNCWALIGVCCLVSTKASAGIVYDLVPVDNSSVYPGEDPAVSDFNDGSYYTFDLVGTVYADPQGIGESWIGALATATLDGPGTFFLHPEGSDIPPDPNLISQYPALEFDTYFTTMTGAAPWFPPGYPEYSGPGGGIITRIDADWSETGDGDFYAGTFQLARLTLQVLETQAVTLTVVGAAGQASSPGNLFPFGPFVVTVPEPGGFALLALGVVGALRRR